MHEARERGGGDALHLAVGGCQHGDTPCTWRWSVRGLDMHEARLQVYGRLHHTSPVLGVAKRKEEREKHKLNARHYDENIFLRFVDSFDGIDNVSILADNSNKFKCFNAKI